MKFKNDRHDFKSCFLYVAFYVFYWYWYIKVHKDYDVTLGQLPCNAAFVNTNRTYSSRDVYAGPSTAYCKVGAIGTSSPTETVYITAEYTYNGQKWAYITYSVPGQKDKSGYIRID